MRKANRKNWNQALSEYGRRITGQRRVILDLLENSQDHIDAERLFLQVKSQDAKISLATVYRTLKMLKEAGLVEEHRLKKGQTQYEAVRREPHFHFTCRICGKVIEFRADIASSIQKKLWRNTGAETTHVHVIATGFCAQCREKKDKNENQSIS